MRYVLIWSRSSACVRMCEIKIDICVCNYKPEDDKYRGS